MQAKVQTTRRFIDPFPYLSLLITGGVFFALILGSAWGKTLVSRQLLVKPDTTEQLQPIELKQEPIGALRIDVRAILPSNQWATYEIQLKDQQGKVIASGIKQAWVESGTWSEEGESGTWAEDDLEGGLDVRTTQSEPVTIALAVLEYSDTAGKEIELPVPFQITVQNGVVDTRYLWPGWFGTLILSLLSLFVVPHTGRVVIKKFMNDSDVGDRATLGGSDRLLRVIVKVKADELAPRVLDVRLVVNDGNGEQIYAHTYPVRLSYSKGDGRTTGANGTLQTFLVLEPKTSYGFHVEVTPDASVDRTTLVVRERARTLRPVQVTYLKST
ncbi:MAG: hypothetical protein HC866_16070 [Leptolyngbyaceae cyanobacterium RU_5_1]|nr:hypothetical protein [Leptolyngbyaceae cyanobacterium RU_5_1]